ncbi:MAG: protein kinase [Acidobacteriota bacterium]|jgi:TolB-like protein
MSGSFETDMVGASVSHYRVLGKLGSGGMGIVYRAEDERLGRAVALKFFSNRSFDDADALERFRREARAASALNHPSICTVHDIGEWEGRPFIVLEYLQGMTLSERLQGETLQLDRILEIAIQITSALRTAHERGIIHRDIKPANVFLTDSGQAKILDFGLAKLTEDPLESISSLPTVSTAAGLTTPGTTIGTVAYMSPEQARGEVLDGRTDLFSLGVMLYEMVTGLLPFRGKTAAVVFKEILTEEPAEPAHVNPDTPIELSRIIVRLLAKDRDSRYQTAAAVEDDLRQLQRVSQSGQLSASEAVTPVPRRRWAKRGLPYVSAAVAALIVVAVLFWTGIGPKVVHAPGPKTIAVLPFSTEAGDPAAVRLSQGLANAIVVRLLQMPELKVASQGTARLFRAAQAGPAQMAKETGVSHILDGSVERQGDRVRVSARLIDLRSDTHLWAQSYDRRISDILTIEDEIAREIAAALELQLAEGSKGKLRDAPPEQLTAYDYYLMGKSYFDLGLLDEAEQRLVKVEELDPGHFSYPQLLLARIYESQGRYDKGRDELDDFLRLHPDAEMADDVAEWRDSLRSRQIHSTDSESVTTAH